MQANISSHVSYQLAWWLHSTHMLVWVSQLSGCSHSTLTRHWKLCFSSTSTHFKKASNFIVTILSWGLWGTGNLGHSEKGGYKTLNTWPPHFLDPWLDLSMPSDWEAPGTAHGAEMQFQSLPWNILMHSVFTPIGNKSKFQQIKILFRIKTCSSCTWLVVFLNSLIIFLNA